jgi:hypothetical protein
MDASAPWGPSYTSSWIGITAQERCRVCVGALQESLLTQHKGTGSWAPCTDSLIPWSHHPTLASNKSGMILRNDWFLGKGSSPSSTPALDLTPQ